MAVVSGVLISPIVSPEAETELKFLSFLPLMAFSPILSVKMEITEAISYGIIEKRWTPEIPFGD